MRRIWTRIKVFLARVLPAPMRSFMRETQSLRTQLAEQAALIQALGDQLNQQAEAIRAQSEQEKLHAREQAALIQALGDQLARQEKERREQKNEIQKIQIRISQLTSISNEIKRSSAENGWAAVFNNTVSESTWLKDKSFSPGRWAVGYQYLYVMYRILNEARPKTILDLGLGQSSRMIAQYAAHYEDVEHYIVEHDPEWIQFFINAYSLPKNSHIIQLPRDFVPYKETESVRVYKDFRETFRGMKFDYISIDGPLGGDMREYARIDVLGILPECLSDVFVITMDDYERSGEQHTVKEMRQILQKNGIPYTEGTYSGEKDMILLCAESSSFLSSM